jgi:hypothetical protein
MRLLVCRTPSGIIREVGEATYSTQLGLLISPRLRVWEPEVAHNLGAPWAADNDAFSGFDEKVYRTMLRKIAGVPGCKFVVAPDVVANADATLRLFSQWWPVLQDYGLPAALVAQDGQESRYVPWDRISTLFIGGSTTWKLSEHAARLTVEAKRRGKWVHMGRVNSNRRIQYAKAIGVDSIDGSGYARFSREMIPPALSALRTHTLPLWEGLCAA